MVPAQMVFTPVRVSVKWKLELPQINAMVHAQIQECPVGTTLVFHLHGTPICMIITSNGLIAMDSASEETLHAMDRAQLAKQHVEIVVF